MSGPVTAEDVSDTPDSGHPSAPCIEVTDSHEAAVGHLTVRRALPRRARRMIGAWCFADHMGPADVTENHSLDVGPHPHIGLQTVTWLIDGEALHKDSLGSEQVIKAGQLNLMTSGNGITHSEEATGHYRGTLQGIQLWVALPEATRAGGSLFEHYSDLPQAELDGGVATVLAGEFAGATSPARHDTALVGAELDLRAQTTMGLEPSFEHGLVVLEGEVGLNGTTLTPGHLGYLGEGRDELRLDVRGPAKVMLIGGVPFNEQIVMWWNFVARTREEITDAYRDWAAQNADRFGRVNSSLPTIPAAAPTWLRQEPTQL